ncbi:thiol reductant ABC exporter subunit CydC [Halalkalibacter krulwichiae]|uniref:Putative multidrug resistance ABC transporter ATP-binding/permease protein YheH n=1 Tax=Halalkalibacter krulwichiae TaxID=199441 RepID=A0A1X9M659_9BACI|nr:thiol reductant ABC exporter subunit CydC [Halalkalibacter krulwichiae]ARK28927.1 putative multidrug resistance ABC transporter ATP-binding/permease protein YheH [Halalkalibacter krulwichiae]
MNELTSIIRFMLRKKKDVVLSILYGYIAGLTAVGLFAANGYLISQAALTPPLYVLITMVAVVKIGSFLRAISRYAERYYSHRATFTMLSDLRVSFYEKIEKKASRLFGSFRSGDLLARIVGDVESIQNVFLRVLYPPIVMALVFLSTIFFVSFYSNAIMLLLILGLIITGLIIPAWFAKKQKNVSEGIREKRAILSTEATEWLHGFRELKIHEKLAEKEEQLVQASDTYVKAQEKEGIQSLSNQSVNMAFSLVASWAILTVGAFLVASGELNGLFLAMLVMVSLTVFEHSIPMAAFPLYYEDSERAAKRLGEVTQEKGQHETGTKQRGEVWKGAPAIEFRDVQFSFPGELRSALDQVNITLPPGSKTAIVGPSGSGKSTLIQLLLRLTEPSAGDIVINQVSIAEMNEESVWKQTNVILQENHFFFGTIKENLLLQTNEQSEKLQQLLNDVELPHFSLTDQVLEKGQNLSGGEKQRLAMARVFAKKGSLWLLDEPVSALDAWTEKQLFKQLFKKAKDDTVVLVSHKLSGLEEFDQIIVMDQGKVMETGTYEELVAARGYFYELHEIEKNIIA